MPCERVNTSEVPRLPRETQVSARKSCVRATRPEPNPYGTAPPTRPAAYLRPTLDIPDPRSLLSETRSLCVYKTQRRGMPATHPRHTRGTPPTRPIPAACHVRRCPGRTIPHACTRHARNARGARARTSFRAGFPLRATVSKTSLLPPRRPNRRI